MVEKFINDKNKRARLSINIDKSLKNRMRVQLVKENKTFVKVIEELFEKYLEEKEE